VPDIEIEEKSRGNPKRLQISEHLSRINIINPKNEWTSYAQSHTFLAGLSCSRVIIFHSFARLLRPWELRSDFCGRFLLGCTEIACFQGFAQWAATRGIAEGR
jgi:hypothetical protein